MRIKSRLQNQGMLDDIHSHANGNKGKGRFERATEAVAEGVSKGTFADNANTSSRIANYIFISSFLDKALVKNFDELPTAMKAFATQRGLDSDIWDIVKGLDKLIDPERGISLGVNADSFDDIAPELLKKVQRPTETIKQTRMRLKHSWINFINDDVNNLSATVTERGTLAKMTNKPLVDGILTGILKFKNIALSQHYETMRVMDAASGLNPDHIGHINAMKAFGRLDLTNPLLSGRYVGSMLAAGAAINWANDLTDLKTPREIDAEFIQDAFLNSGGAGLAGILYETGLHSKDIIASPSEALVEPGINLGKAVVTGDGDKMKKAGVRAVERYVPFFNMWHTRAISKRLFRKAVGVELQRRHERRLMRERGQENIEIFD